MYGLGLPLPGEGSVVPGSSPQARTTLMLGVWKPHLLPHVPWTSGKQISDGCERLWAFFFFPLWLEALEEEKPPEPGTLTEGVLTQQEVGSQSGGEGQEQGCVCAWAWAVYRK